MISLKRLKPEASMLACTHRVELISLLDKHTLLICEVKTISHCDFTFLTRKISQSQSLSLTQSTSENGHQCVSGSSSVV
ncbi:unnamed protein product [Parnassius apollo]|uniref:(apollo) hypothetical protein n=1 Tax=Parnassius apollo TaxID=110799 RepID=A0A8S3XHF0_PARAO|nr:unnamed protein product [Parnassius apollo]